MAVVRIRSTVKYMILIVTLVIFILYLLSGKEVLPCAVDCSRYQSIIKDQDELLKSFHNLRLKFQRDNRSQNDFRQNVSMIYMITPTYTRWSQKADLSRLCFTLMHIQNLHWIVVEDSDEKTLLVKRLLSGQESCKISHTTHLNVRTPEEKRLGDKDPVWKKHRGVEQRNLGIDWLREKGGRRNLSSSAEVEGVVYFGDDDNTYDTALFKEMRYTKKVSMWPVGICGGLKFEGPVCSSEGKVTGWYSAWAKERKFQVDMAGFAINLKLLLSKSNAYFRQNVKLGHLEDSLLNDLIVSLDEVEARADDCTKILVWHTRTEPPKMVHENKLMKLGKPSNPHIEV